MNMRLMRITADCLMMTEKRSFFEDELGDWVVTEDSSSDLMKVECIPSPTQ